MLPLRGAQGFGHRGGSVAVDQEVKVFGCSLPDLFTAEHSLGYPTKEFVCQGIALVFAVDEGREGWFHFFEQLL